MTAMFVFDGIYLRALFGCRYGIMQSDTMASAAVKQAAQHSKHTCYHKAPQMFDGYLDCKIVFPVLQQDLKINLWTSRFIGFESFSCLGKERY
jgi:hypothetical protein